MNTTMITPDEKNELQRLILNPPGTTRPAADTIEDIQNELGFFLDPVELERGNIPRDNARRAIEYLRNRGYDANVYGNLMEEVVKSIGGSANRN